MDQVIPSDIDLDQAVAELEAAADALTSAVVAVIDAQSMHPARAIYAVAVMLSAMVDDLPATVRRLAAEDVIRLIETGLAEMEASEAEAVEEPVPA